MLRSLASSAAAPPPSPPPSTSPPVGNHYDKTATRHRLERRMVTGFDAALASVLPTTARRILDIGCGEGHHMGHVTRLYPDAHVCGIDIAPPDWLIRWHRPGSPVAVTDAAALPFRPRSFDLVLALEVLEHLPDPHAAIRQITAVCQGSVILSVPWEPIWRAGNLIRGRYVAHLGNTPGHIQHFTRRAFLHTVGHHLEVHAVRRPVPWTLVSAHTR